MTLLPFLRENARWLAAGALLSFLSSFGQTFFIALFAGELRDEFALSLGQWGGIYAVGTATSAAIMVFAGTLADKIRIRTLGLVIISGLALSCFGMAFNPSGAALVLVILALRFTGQGMLTHLSVVAMARWFTANRGKALAVATLGFSFSEAILPIPVVWLKGFVDWHLIWVGAGFFCLAMLPIVWVLLRLERSPKSIADESAVPGMDNHHWTRLQAIRQPLFWSISLGVMLFSAIGTSFWFHQVHFAEVKGWTHLSLVAVFPLGTVAFSLSVIGYGLAIDRFGADKLLPVYLLPLTVAFLLHALAPDVSWTALGVILMGIAGGGQATLPAACWALFFGTRNIGSIKAVVVAIMVLGSALGPFITGALIDFGIGFEAQLTAFGVLFAGVCVLIGVTVKPARTRLPTTT